MVKQIHVEQARCFMTNDLEQRIMELLKAFPSWRLINTTFIDKRNESVSGTIWEVYYFWMIFDEEID